MWQRQHTEVHPNDLRNRPGPLRYRTALEVRVCKGSLCLPTAVRLGEQHQDWHGWTFMQSIDLDETFSDRQIEDKGVTCITRTYV